MDNNSFSIGFPDISGKEIIYRNNYIAQIDNYFEKDYNLIFIEGEEDSGKTILCAQYAKKENDLAISVFFNPNHDLYYNLTFFCTNFVKQAKNILKEIEDSESDFHDFEEYTNCLFPLRKFLKKNKRKITIIIDGIESIANSENTFFKELLSVIPFGEKIFRIIISGDQKKFIENYPRIGKNSIKSVNLTGFSQPEMEKFLGINDVSENDLRDLYKITKGLPGRLKTVKRRIDEEGIDFKEISESTSYSHWLELDCKTIDISNSINEAIISLLCLGKKSFPIEEIAEICTTEKDYIENLVLGNSLFEVSNRIVNFSSNSHKQYFANLLRGNKKLVDEMLIKYYASEESITALIELPKLHANSKDWLKVINILDENYLPKIVENTGSLQVVNESLKLGVDASISMQKHAELWRYSIQGSIVNELDNFQFWESEIMARIALQDFAGAIGLASSAVLKIDRLRLLVLIAKRQKKLNNNIDEDLIKLIKDLYETTDLYSVGDKLYDIVSDLLYAIPNLAIEIIEKSSETSSETDINDWIVTKLSLAAIDSSDKENQNETDSKKIEAIQGLNNKSVKKINKAISFLVGNYTSKKVIEEVNKLSESKEKLRLLRLWLNNNENNLRDLGSVIDLALNEIIKSSSEASLNYDSLKEFTQLLPFIKSKEEKENLLKRFKQIEGDISDIGSTRNKIIYHLNIFHTEFTLLKNSWKISLSKITKEAERIEDPLVKLECFSEIYYKLITIRNDEIRKTNNWVYALILSLTKKLFIETAHHYRITKNVLNNVGKRNPILGLKICDLINTVDRKEKAKILVLESYLDNNVKDIKIDLLVKIEESLEWNGSREFLILSILERFSDAKSLNYKLIEQLLYFINKISKIHSSSNCLAGYVLAYKIFAKDPAWQTRRSLNCQTNIYNTWNQIESEWDKINHGFTVSSDLAEIAPIFAKKIFTESENLKNSSWLDSNIIAYTYILSVKVIINAYGSLIQTSNATPDDYNIIDQHISRISSDEEKIRLWTEVGFICLERGDDHSAKKILESHVIPLLITLHSKKFPLRRISSSLIFIHLFNSEMGKEYIELIDSEFRDNIFSDLSYYYISKRSPFEFFEEDIFKYKCTFSDITKSIDAIKNATTDNIIYIQIKHICTAIKESKRILSHAQITALIKSLEDIITLKLPDLNNVKHDGYKILSEATLATIKTRGIDNNLYWDEALEKARLIPNHSDLLLVLSILLDLIPFSVISNGKNKKQDLYNEIKSQLNKTNVHFEYVQRVIDITDIMHKVNKTDWNLCVSKAFELSDNLESGRETYSSQKRIIDTMYRLDPKFAKTLISTIDPAKNDERICDLLKEHYESLEVAKKIKNDTELKDKEKENNRVVVKALVNALKSLNSEKISPKKLSELLNYLKLGNQLPLHEVFPVYLYYLSNCSKTYNAKKLTGNVANIHIENFREAVKATELVRLLSHKRKVTEKSSRRHFIDSEFSANHVVNHSTREEAMRYIKDWMSENAKDFLIIADPYFEESDLEILKWINDSCENNIEVDILGSKNGNDLEIENKFHAYWKKISDQYPPFTSITFCWIPEKNNSTPFHDRWIITKDGGLRLGTSINSLGIIKESEISVMQTTDALKIQENILIEYIGRKKKAHNNQRLSYKVFTI